jgi:hypothetical protein
MAGLTEEDQRAERTTGEAACEPAGCGCEEE